MATVVFSIDTYRIDLGFQISTNGGARKYRGGLICFGKDNYRLEIYFIEPGNTIYPPQSYLESKWGEISFPFTEMQNFIDLVRNEKPVFGYISGNHPEWNGLSTSREPVGDFEP